MVTSKYRRKKINYHRIIVLCIINCSKMKWSLIGPKRDIAFRYDNNSMIIIKNDRPARLNALCGVYFYERCIYVFALSSMSSRDCPLL